MRILGLDVGERRIGVAISDPDEHIAVPLQVIERREKRRDIDVIRDLVQREAVGAVVVGVPVSLSGEEGPQAGQVRAFGETLAQALPVPVLYWDERLSTVEADRLLAQAGERSRQRWNWRDAVAASIILQACLDARRTGAEPGRKEDDAE